MKKKKSKNSKTTQFNWTEFGKKLHQKQCPPRWTQFTKSSGSVGGGGGVVLLGGPRWARVRHMLAPRGSGNAGQVWQQRH